MWVIFKFWIGYLFRNSACVLSCEKILTVKFMLFGDFFVLNELFTTNKLVKLFQYILVIVTQPLPFIFYTLQI